MAAHAGNAEPADEAYPGQRVGLPATGRGSLATWGSRVTALALDWAICMALAVGLFGSGVLTGGGWRAWMMLTVFFVQSTAFSWLAGGSVGQLICRIRVHRLDQRPLGLLRAALRAGLICLVLPALIIGGDRRGLHDMAVGTAVIKLR